MRKRKMSEEVIRYGAGGAAYKGVVGAHSTDVEPTPQPEPEPEVTVTVEVKEDDTPLTDEQVAKKTKGGNAK